jgi:hypothetical protein
MNEESQGKISESFKGLGTVTAEMVEQRARELAVIDGREPNKFTKAEWEQARQELLGAEVLNPQEEPPEGAVSASDDILVTPPVCNTSRRDEETENVARTLIEQGLDEAEHDRIKEAGEEEIKIRRQNS